VLFLAEVMSETGWPGCRAAETAEAGGGPGGAVRGAGAVTLKARIAGWGRVYDGATVAARLSTIAPPLLLNEPVGAFGRTRTSSLAPLRRLSIQWPAGGPGPLGRLRSLPVVN
jgi:hypothetical protein